MSLNLVRQGCKSTSDDGITCLYRGTNNTKCAAGWLIPDSDYDQEKMEGRSWRILLTMDLVPGHFPELIDCLQRIHDNMSVAVWEDTFNELREKLRPWREATTEPKDMKYHDLLEEIKLRCV